MLAGERGSVTAEFAAVVPAVLLLLACCLASVQLVAQQVRLQDAAASVARSAGRGGATSAAALMPGATASVSQRGDLVCARLSLRPAAPMAALLGVTLRASSCALAGGQ